MMGPTDVLEVLDRLACSHRTAWLDGGWSVNTLIGEQTRRHRDLDLVIARRDPARAHKPRIGLDHALRRAAPSAPACLNAGAASQAGPKVTLESRQLIKAADALGETG